MGFRFSENPRQESSVFRPLLHQREGTVVRPIIVRDQDDKPYIYVAAFSLMQMAQGLQQMVAQFSLLKDA